MRQVCVGANFGVLAFWQVCWPSTCRGGEWICHSVTNRGQPVPCQAESAQFVDGMSSNGSNAADNAGVAIGGGVYVLCAVARKK